MKTILFFVLLLLCGSVNSANAQNLYSVDLKEANETADTNLEDNENDATINISNYKWEFASFVPNSFDEITVGKSVEHEFGEKIACLKVLMDKYYINKEEVVPGDPMRRTIIKKPNIYSTVNKIEKYLKRGVKKGELDLSSAESYFAYVLEVAIAVVDTSDSDSFELALKESKRSVPAQLDVFRQVKLNKIY